MNGARTTGTELLCVESVGMVSSLGLNAASSCAALRAGITRFEEVPFHDQDRNPIIGAPALEAVPNRQGYRRLAPLLARAIQECVGERLAPRSPRHESMPLLIHVDSSDRPDYPPDLVRRLLIELKEHLPREMPVRTEIYQEGKTGFFRSLLRARQLLKTSDIEGCVIASADSFLNLRALGWLEEQNRLKTEGNVDGIIPGEAAAAVWVTRADRHKASMLHVAGIGLGQETSVLEEDTPNRAVGLAEAIRTALTDANLEFSALDFRVGGMTGERVAFKEASIALARVQRVRKESFELVLPAENLGDVGVALPACMVVTTAMSFTQGYAPGRSAILFSASRSPERAACVVWSPNGGSYGN